jgi:solute carrier family 25 (mitochondrial carnitine/acylcarnitine transporter), member 20/29
MTIHDEKRVEWYKEGLYSLITGFLFGATNSFVGHPFDTIKTKMQAQRDFIGKMGYIDSIKLVYRNDGLIGFYRGVIPPLAGGVIYRSLQMSGYETMYAKCEHHDNMKKTIPFTGGI